MNYNEEDINNNILKYELNYCLNILLNEIIESISLNIVKEIIGNFSESYLKSRPLPPERNLFIHLISDLINEVLLDFSKNISKECINECVNDYLEHRYVNQCYDYVERELFSEELTKIATDEIFDETCLKLQTKLLTLFLDNEIIPQIAVECRHDTITEQAGEIDRQDHIALENCMRRYLCPQLVTMHLMMSMLNSFDSVMIHYFVKGIMKRIVSQRLLSVMYQLESKVNHVLDNEVERQLFERMVIPTIQDEFIHHLITSSSQREDEIDEIESYFANLNEESDK